MSKQIEELLANSKEQRQKNDPHGVEFANEAYTLANQLQNLPLQIEALKEKIHYALYVASDFKEGERLGLELLDILNEQDYAEEIALAYNMLGICNDVSGNYINSRNYYVQAIDVLNRQQRLSFDGNLALGNAYFNTAKLYLQIELDDDRAIYLEKALKVFESLDNVDGLARVWNLKASQLPEDAPIEQRLEIFEKALSYFERGTDKRGLAVCMGNIGLCYCRLNQFDKGLDILAVAMEKIKETNNKALFGFALFQTAEALRLKGDHQQALEYLQQAEQVLLNANAKIHLNVVYKEWATNLAAVGNYGEAYEKILKFTEYVNDNIKFDRQSAVAEAQLKFELDKKEKESELLRRKNEEIELFNQKLKYSSAELNQFAYVASHDLKEPLRMVSNYMQLLEKSLSKELTEDQATYIRYANEGAKRMYKLIDSLLVFSRATIDSEIKLVNLNDVVDQVRRIVISSVKRNVQINADELPTILGDYNQMVHLFQNLLANSVKYNDKEEVVIHISYTPQTNAHRISVEDNGIGIPLRYRETVFEIFKRLHDRESYSGTGIGLSICRKIVHSLNGRIWIEDGIMGGSAFVFTIPKKSASA